MAQTCTKCSRANPAEAVYCYFDGFVLGGHRNGGPVAVGTKLFRSPLVFPSGRSCRSFNELALACQEDWVAARDLLTQGYLENFFSGLGRLDLALAAKEAARFPDRDRGLDQLLAQLPTNVLAEPTLKVEPLEINLGALGRGAERSFKLHLENSGMRLLYGSVNSGEGWLALGDPPGASEKHFQFTHEQNIAVRVRTERLRASSKPVQARLLIESNAGSAEVVVRAEAPAKPFPDGVLGGARSPRQVAEKAKAHPKEAAALFEDGSVAAWYKENGWTYPVQGPSASGLGAVQQFFEALGLTPPPKVRISDRAITLQGSPGETLSYALEVRSEEKRPVYAHGVSNQSWLEVSRANLNGRVATLNLQVPRVPDRPGETLSARLSVQSNGNQRFVVPVTLQIGGQFDFSTIDNAAAPTIPEPPPLPVVPPPAAPPVTPSSLVLAPPLPRRRQRGGTSRGVHLAPACLLAVALVGVMVWDFVSPYKGTPSAVTADRDGLGLAYDASGDLVLQFSFSKYDPRETNYRFGLVLLQQKDPNNPDAFKKLTFQEKGASNNTCVRIDGSDFQYGRPPGKRGGREVDKKERHIWQTVWFFPDAGVRVTQLVQIVPGAQSGQLDTCLVHYILKNESNLPRKVGLRVLLDTYIGANDGVPFAIPGRPGLLIRPAVFEKDKVPDYIQALERPDLKDPGTVAHLGLKGIQIPNVELEPISKLILCPWESDAVGWEVKIADENKDKDIRDTCVVLYWAEKSMDSGEVRHLAFTYGLNPISTPEGSGNLALTVGGSFVAGNTFTATAYVKDPQAGQTVKLTLPEGLSFVSGQQAEQAVEARAGYSQVSWRVHSDKAGDYVLRATSGTAGVGHKVRITTGSLFR
jgi:hypothetical protein